MVQSSGGRGRWIPPGSAVPAAALLVFFALGLWNAWGNSGVADEIGGHIDAGYLYLKSGRYSGGIANFPLGHVLMALPAALLGVRHEVFSEEGLLVFRLPVLLLGVVLGVLVYRMGAQLYGRRAGLAALFLYALSPNIIAHSSLATLDFPLAFFVLATLCALRWYVAAPTAWRALGLSGVLAGALATKIQALLLLPLIAVVLGVVFGRRLLRRERSGRLIASWTLLLGVPFVGLNLVYLNWPPATGAWLPGPFVEALRIKFHHAQHPQVGYLLGSYSMQGWWYYFPVALLVKTPLATLALLLPALWRRPQRDTVLFVLLPLVGFLALGMLAQVNIGLRHVLMVCPFLFLLAGREAAGLWQRSWRGLLLGLLGAFYVAEAARITPHQLSYFNQLAGGPRHGHRVLVDSNYDWGQNDRYLRDYVRRHPGPWQINPDPFRFTPGRILVNANAFYGIYIGGGADAYAWLKAFQPTGQIAYTWFEFHVPGEARAQAEERLRESTPRPVPTFRPWPATLDAGALREALADVTGYLREVRARHAALTTPEVGMRLGLAWTSLGAYQDALDEMRALLRQDPGLAPALGLGGEIMVQWKLGLLRFEGEQYLTGFRRSPAPASPPSLEQAVRAATAAGVAVPLAQVHYTLYQALLAQGALDQAGAELAAALRFQPDEPELQLKMGLLAVRMGRFVDGEELLRRALTAIPERAPLVAQMAGTLTRQQRYGDARDLLRLVRERVPAYPDAAIQLSLLLAECPLAEVRESAEALRLAREVCERTQKRNPRALQALAVACRANGDLAAAIAAARSALQCAGERGDADLAAELRALLAQYEQAARPPG
ncbi:MAG TPA: glycosyltransferase family 39 protein [Phycisphaerae bacterium]|nr:glycosyltransferase family 39 protein [Phycisphaerae bacterium]HNU46744.1 glycosyltransferase family 39 protein [Phycisphaerae bacterium]